MVRSDGTARSPLVHGPGRRTISHRWGEFAARSGIEAVEEITSSTCPGSSITSIAKPIAELAHQQVSDLTSEARRCFGAWLTVSCLVSGLQGPAEREIL